jgi:hypothetical protein
MAIKIPRSLFTQNAPRAGRSVLSESTTMLVAGCAVPLGVGSEHNGYRIHTALHARNPGTRVLLEIDHGKHLVVAVHHAEGVIGFVRRDLLWVDPDHRGRGLGPEMAAQLVISMGCQEWDLDEWRDWLNTPQFTVDGYRNRCKIYDILVRRGVIEEP